MEGMSEEKCALVAELMQVLDTLRQLEVHMAAGQQQGGDQRCRALVSTMRASIDRAVHMAMSCCAEAGRPAAAGQPESPPSGGDGSPRSGGSDQAGDFRGRGNAAGQLCKKRKTLPKVSTQVRVSTVQDVSPLDDGLSWRKYGQKDILGAKYPRAYFRCTHRHTQSCHASKQVQRTDGDPLLFDVVYHGTHTCAQAPHGAAAHPTNNQGARPPAAAASAEHPKAQPPKPAAEPVLPFSLPSNGPVCTHDAGGATSSRFASGCVAASPFVSPATPECLQASSSYAAGSGMSMAGARNVPDVEVELASTTHSSPMGGMDFMFPLDTADFLDNPGSYF